MHFRLEVKWLRTFFQTEFYVKNIMTRSHRSALAKFRCDAAPISLETVRYEKLLSL